jgi:hypothetical protein
VLVHSVGSAVTVIALLACCVIMLEQFQYMQPNIDHMSAGFIEEEAIMTCMSFGHRVWCREESVTVPMSDEQGD